jgi:hypothetical protein
MSYKSNSFCINYETEVEVDVEVSDIIKNLKHFDSESLSWLQDEINLILDADEAYNKNKKKTLYDIQIDELMYKIETNYNLQQIEEMIETFEKK